MPQALKVERSLERSSERSSPGLPAIPLTPSTEYLIANLWTLTTVKSSTIKNYFLLLPAGITVNDAVELAKRFAKGKNSTFNWLEKTVNDLRSEGV